MQHLCRRSTSELGEVVNHMHLVVIAELVRHIRPGPCRESRLVTKGRFKPRDPHEELRSHSHLVDESSFKLAYAQVCGLGKSTQIYPSPGQHDLVRSNRHAIAAKRPQRPR